MLSPGAIVPMDAVEIALKDGNGPLPLYLDHHTGHESPSVGDVCRSSSCQYMCLDVSLGISKPDVLAVWRKLLLAVFPQILFSF